MAPSPPPDPPHATQPGPDPGDGLRRRAARFVHWVVHLRGSPEAIALGAAVGIVVAFTPTLGLQIVLATLLATALDANRPAAILMTAITSPPTIPPLYAFTYWVGTRLWPGPPVSEAMARLQEALGQLMSASWSDFTQPLASMALLGRDVFVPLWIGGLLTGLLAAAIVYVPLVRFVRFSRERLAALREHRATRHVEGRNGTGSG